MRVLAAVAITLAVGCGSAASAPGGSEGADETSLRISFWADGNDGPKDGEKPRQWTLRCDPPAGSHPNEADACRRLKAMKQPFRAPRKDVMCTQEYGGPQEATVSGVYQGRRVFASLSLKDGCQISRFTRLAFLVPGFRLASRDS